MKPEKRAHGGDICFPNLRDTLLIFQIYRDRFFLTNYLRQIFFFSEVRG